MAKEAINSKDVQELETIALERVAEFSSRFGAATLSDEVICALHSLAALIFSVDSSLVSGAVDQPFSDQILGFRNPTNDERISLKQAFYKGSAFPTMARLLILNICPKWLDQFPKNIRSQIYDSFFLEGPSIEVLETLVPFLSQKGSDIKGSGLDKICSNVERLLITCLLEKEGIRHIVDEFFDKKDEENIHKKDEKRNLISRVAQLLVSIPDKIRFGASSKLSASSFFKRVAIQLIIGAEERAVELFNIYSTTDKKGPHDFSFVFVGETFSRIIRRGSTDILVSEIVPRICELVKSCLASNSKESISILIESNPKSRFWLNLIETIKDNYSIERLSEAILRQLALRDLTDLEAYWILWLLFNNKQTASIRTIFVEKFLLRKVFPLSCLRWILQYSVLECPPNCREMQLIKAPHFLNTIQRLVSIWCKKDFMQSSSIEQQAYLTAAVGLCLEKMSKQELETTKDVLNFILQGVSCRLESPIDMVRKMASAIALTFSKIVDPKNPLYLDDNQSDTINWEFGVLTQKKQKEIIIPKEKKREIKKSEKLEISSSVLIEEISENVENKNEEEDYESDSDESLEPYDLSDDDSDLKEGFNQLGDVLNALRKPDDPDGVERALDTAEKLVRASPDELPHISPDLVRALVHVRVADVAAEGDEEPSEAKRQKSLTALLVTSPFESLDSITKLLYSSSVDLGQRILILDVMTEAALELSQTKVLIRGQNRNLIASVEKPWFVPNNKGPIGSGPWREISEPGTSMFDNWAYRYEREVPSRERKVGKTRKWSLGKPNSGFDETRNRFPLYAAAFMLPAMQGFDKKKQGVDLINRDFVVLGKLVYMLGVCIKCCTMHPEASALAPALLDMIKSRDVCNHAEAYVRRAVLFAASCILLSIHPSYVASALIEGELEISSGLDWIRTYSLRIAETDPDTECSSMAMNCLQLHSEMALEASRALESADQAKTQTRTLPSKLDKIIIPFANMK